MPQTWMITGANRGIGLALTMELLRRGDHVVAAARDPWGGALAELAGVHVGQLTPLELDVTSDQSVAAAKRAFDGRPIDVLVNNAGVYGPRDRQSALDMDFKAWREVFEVNVYAPLRVAQAFLPNVEAGTGRKIVTISSRMGSIGSNPSGAIAYRSSKAAVNMAMVGFGNAVRDSEVAVLLFHPGWVRTDMGGGGADIPPTESAAGLIATIDASGMRETNSFRNWKGEEIPW
ncbi:SDR family oxidoreductase [Bosea sp. (in: a-proteobacteria)]|jgi:NAD(P)-dependent dehydrogenase (short-subunit alcohol dehydrogenase family)|uniref:SDR family oxidoreductase n=1 Tax=Bosea sp. (in: a-proteobacteria) TaxID=1871050 RepID=UPI002DDD8006|nr:SDR family oxidoreductase [Bosea sp. (in: a-proteobacteria)]HEV2509410.1 SDR family oxidoreductase [Bosea sp. (in: a-proteobacteria)]